MKKRLALFVVFGIILPALLSFALARALAPHQGVLISMGGQPWKEKNFADALTDVWKNKFEGAVEVQSWIRIPSNAKEIFFLKGMPGSFFVDDVQQSDLSNCATCISRNPLPAGWHSLKIRFESIPNQTTPTQIWIARNDLEPRPVASYLLYTEKPKAFVFYGTRFARIAGILARLDLVLLLAMPLLIPLYRRVRPFFNRSNLPLFLLLLLMAVLRFHGIFYQLEEGIHPDERVVERTASIIRSGSVKVQNYYYTLGFHYITAAVESITTWVLGEEPPAHLVPRVLSCLFSMLCCVYVYIIGNLLLSRTIAMIAVVLFGFSYMPVLLAHYGIIEPAMLFFFLLAFRLILNLSKDARRKDFVIAGIASGVALAVKQTAAVILVPFLSIYLYTFRRELFQKSTISKVFYWGIPALVIFLLLSPFLFVDFDHFLRDQRFQMQLLAGRTAQSFYFLEGQRGFSKILEYLSDGVGYPLLVASLLGVILIVFTSLRAAVAIVPITVGFCLITSSAQAPPYHYPFLLCPFLALLAAVTIDRVSRAVPLRHAAAVLLVGGILFVSIGKIARLEKILSFEDTRGRATEWCYRHLPVESRIDYEQFGPRFLIPVFRARLLQTWGRDPWDQYVNIRKPDYYIQDSTTSDVFLKKSAQSFPNEHAWFSQLRQHSDVVQEFTGLQYGLYNPHIVIYKIRK